MSVTPPDKKQGSFIRILSWNISGWKNRMSDGDLLEFLSKFDIIALQETWLTTSDEEAQITGFRSWFTPARKFKSKGRASGGLCVFAKAEMGWQGHQLVIREDPSYFLAIQFKYKSSEVVLLNAYLPPSSSPCFSPDIWVQLEKTIVEINIKYCKAVVILLGDFNTRVGASLHDYAHLRTI